jgi:hypothetical protein
MSVRTVRALLSQQLVKGPWRVFVTLPGVPAGDWPTYAWPAGAPAPTTAQRLAALAELGYRPIPGAEWEWCEAFPEAEPIHDGAASSVTLLAGLAVLPIGGAG